jgi:hypothetical protein
MGRHEMPYYIQRRIRSWMKCSSVLRHYLVCEYEYAFRLILHVSQSGQNKKSVGARQASETAVYQLKTMQ